MARYMNLLTDFGFKYVFGSEKHKKVLIQFLNGVVDEKDKIIDVTFRDKEALPIQETGKRMVYDIYCLTHDHRHIIVEMQKAMQPTFAERTLLYTTHLLLRQLHVGESYNLKPVYEIFLTNFNLIGHNPKMIRRVGLADIDDHQLFSNKFKMVYLDLKLMTHVKIEDCKNEAEKWLFLIKNIGQMEDKLENYPMYDDLFNAADTGMLAADDFVTYGNSLRKMKDDLEGIKWEKEQSKAEGFKEGEIKGALNTLRSLAKKFLAKGMDIDQVADMLDTDPQTIASII